LLSCIAVEILKVLWVEEGRSANHKLCRTLLNGLKALWLLDRLQLVHTIALHEAQAKNLTALLDASESRRSAVATECSNLLTKAGGSLQWALVLVVLVGAMVVAVFFKGGATRKL
jgi:hypothetical protein